MPSLAFALGMFIPLELNVPLLVGGAINWYVTSRSKDAKVNSERGEKGTLIASGFIAGGALMGVVSALLKFGGIEVSIADSWWVNPMSEVCSLLAYICLIGFFIRATKKKKNRLFINKTIAWMHLSTQAIFYSIRIVFLSYDSAATKSIGLTPNCFWKHLAK